MHTGWEIAERLGVTVRQSRAEFARAVCVAQAALARADCPRHMIEVGALEGGSAVVLAAALRPGARIVLVDVCDRGVDAALQRSIDWLRGEGWCVDLVVGWSESPDTLAAVSRLGLGHNVGVVHVDGGHTIDCVLANWRDFRGYVAPGGVMLFHDVGPPGGVHDAWLDIVEQARGAGHGTAVMGGGVGPFATGIGVVQF